ncbi:MAG: PEP-CTERM sorting domain-containing protein [Phormidesmis sp.]
MSTFTKGVALATAGVLLSTGTAQAASFSSIRIGDADGFGYGDGAGYTAANGNSVNVDGQGVLGNGDFIADLNGDGRMATGSNDNFDHRAEEKSNYFITGSGFTNNGSSGSQYTDVSLSVSALDDFYGITPLKTERQNLIAQRDSINVSDLNAQIKSLKTQRTGLQTERSRLVEQKEAIERSIKDINAEDQALKDAGYKWRSSERESLREEREVLKDEKSALTEEITTLNQQSIIPINALISEKENERTSLNAEKAALNNSAEALKTEIEAMREEFHPQESKIPQPEFLFDFTVDRDSVVEDSAFYLNMLFADHDVKNAEIKFTTAETSFTRNLTKQQNNDGQDGLIQSAFVELTFDEIFSAVGDQFNGYIKAEVIAPDEPYLAFDFVELSASKIVIEKEDPTEVPEPTAALGLLVMGAMGAGSLKKRQHV